MKKVVYVLIFVLLPYGGVTLASNAISINPGNQMRKGKSELVRFSTENENLKAVRDFNSGGINLGDPQ